MMIVRMYIISLLDCCVYPGISSVKSDFSLVNSIKTEGKTHISKIALERCIYTMYIYNVQCNSNQFNYLIKIKIFL